MKTKNSLENNSQVSTNQLQDELASASTGPHLLNYPAAGPSVQPRDSYTGSNQLATMATGTMAQQQSSS